MKRINCYQFTLGVLFVSVAVLTGATLALAQTPKPNSARIGERIFNDCPVSTLVTVNTYPALISISDDADDACVGFANLHNWRFSQDGTTKLQFMNADIFRFGADLVIAGPGDGEGGLMISPWFSQQVDGRFNVRTTDGEIAVFGGALPFYSFSNPPHSIRYTKGELIHLEMNYEASGDTTVANPSQIEYKIVYQGQSYSSGLLNFTNCNEGERDIYGCYGVLNFAVAGGHIQPLWQLGPNPRQAVSATWRDITFFSDVKPPVSVTPSTWGRVKVLYR